MADDRKPSLFFRVILEPVLESKKLNLPLRSAAIFGDELSDTATFKIPDGRDWEIKIKKEGNKFWFEDGWDGFVNHYSIGVGYFLVFQYQENSTFHVRILDTSTFEIQYPKYNRERFNRVKVEKNSEDEMEVDDSVDEKNSKSSDRNQPSRSRGRPRKMASTKRRESKDLGDTDDESDDKKDDHPSKGIEDEMEVDDCVDEKNSKISDRNQPSRSRGRPRKKVSSKKRESEDLDGTDDESNDEEDDDHPSEGIEENKFFQFLENKGICMSNTQLEVVERNRAISAAVSFSPKNPAFMILLRSYSVSKGFLNVPTVFGKKYLSANIGMMIKLYFNGNEWNVLLRQTERSFVIGQGWNVFARENNLQKDDICVFELIKREEVVLKVSMSCVSD